MEAKSKKILLNRTPYKQTSNHFLPLRREGAHLHTLQLCPSDGDTLGEVSISQPLLEVLIFPHYQSI